MGSRFLSILALIMALHFGATTQAAYTVLYPDGSKLIVKKSADRADSLVVLAEKSDGKTEKTIAPRSAVIWENGIKDSIHESTRKII